MVCVGFAVACGCALSDEVQTESVIDTGTAQRRQFQVPISPSDFLARITENFCSSDESHKNLFERNEFKTES